MDYINGLISSNLKTMSEMLKLSIASQHIVSSDISSALSEETSPIPVGGDIYNITSKSQRLLNKLSGSPDRDMTIIVKKMLRATKYAATTYYSVSGLDGNPHHLPLTRTDEKPVKKQK